MIEAKLKKVRELLEKLRAEERELAEKLAEAKTSAVGSIKAEVTGVLRHKGKGECYYLSLWSPNGETRVWILPANDKDRDHLGTLHGKTVFASGPMYQTPCAESHALHHAGGGSARGRRFTCGQRKSLLPLGRRSSLPESILVTVVRVESSVTLYPEGVSFRIWSRN